MRGWWHVGGVLFTRHSYNKSCARGSTATLRVHSSRFARGVIPPPSPPWPGNLIRHEISHITRINNYGVMHVCGHDACNIMLLGTLAQTSYH
ncbi:hypothetical protein WJX79_004801 [Trebouxia sp. C0005]